MATQAIAFPQCSIACSALRTTHNPDILPQANARGSDYGGSVVNVYARNRDRGEPHGSTPPTPPCVRVRTRRFGWLSAQTRRQALGYTLRRQWFGPSSAAIGASPLLSSGKASSAGLSAAFHSREARSYSPLQPFGPSISSRSSTMPSADSCFAFRVPYGSLSPVSETRCRPPGVSSTAFTAHLPDLQT